MEALQRSCGRYGWHGPPYRPLVHTRPVMKLLQGCLTHSSRCSTAGMLSHQVGFVCAPHGAAGSGGRAMPEHPHAARPCRLPGRAPAAAQWPADPCGGGAGPARPGRSWPPRSARRPTGSRSRRLRRSRPRHAPAPPLRRTLPHPSPAHQAEQLTYSCMNVSLDGSVKHSS